MTNGAGGLPNIGIYTFRHLWAQRTTGSRRQPDLLTRVGWRNGIPGTLWKINTFLKDPWVEVASGMKRISRMTQRDVGEWERKRRGLLWVARVRCGGRGRILRSYVRSVFSSRVSFVRTKLPAISQN